MKEKRSNQVCSFTIRHDQFNITFQIKKDDRSLLIVAENVETSEKFIRCLDKRFIAQQQQFIKGVFEQPQDILDYLITNHSSIRFQDSLLKFKYEYADKKQKAKEISINMRKKKSKNQEKQVADQARDSKINILEVKCKAFEQFLSAQKKKSSQKQDKRRTQKKYLALKQKYKKQKNLISKLAFDSKLNRTILSYKLNKQYSNDHPLKEEEKEELYHGRLLIKWTQIKDIYRQVPRFNIIAEVQSVSKVDKNEVKVTLQDETGKITAYLKWSQVPFEKKNVALYKAETRLNQKNQVELYNPKVIYLFEADKKPKESIYLNFINSFWPLRP